jgi:hypothetical protein
MVLAAARRCDSAACCAPVPGQTRRLEATFK